MFKVGKSVFILKDDSHCSFFKKIRTHVDMGRHSPLAVSAAGQHSLLSRGGDLCPDTGPPGIVLVSVFCAVVAH